MPENFFERWSRRKAQQVDAAKADHGQTEETTRSETDRPPAPTMQDVARLHAESDYSAFFAGGVDKSVRRAALKKLFSDPHFNIMDGLDIYIDDYTKASPLSAGMLAALQHAQNTLSPQSSFPRRRMPDEKSETGSPSSGADATAPDMSEDKAVDLHETFDDNVQLPSGTDRDEATDDNPTQQTLPPTPS